MIWWEWHHGKFSKNVKVYNNWLQKVLDVAKIENYADTCARKINMVQKENSPAFRCMGKDKNRLSLM